MTVNHQVKVRFLLLPQNNSSDKTVTSLSGGSSPSSDIQISSVGQSKFLLRIDNTKSCFEVSLLLFFAGVAQRLVRLPSKQRMTVRFCSPALCKVVKSLLLRFCRFDSDHILDFRICGEMVYTKVCRTFNFNTNFNCSLYIYFLRTLGRSGDIAMD